MEFARPSSLADALALMAEAPDTIPLAGGTDLLVAMNSGRLRPRRMIAIDRLAELSEVAVGERVRLGAAVTYSRITADTGGSRALAEAARAVGSPQIRNAGTIGGNLGTSSPAGDTLPVLFALGASVHLRSRNAERHLPIDRFVIGTKRNARRPDELIVAVEWDDSGPAQAFVKVGARSAMVIAIASVAVVIDRVRRVARIAVGSCGPTVMRAARAEAFASGLLDESGWERPLVPSDAACRAFGDLVAAATRPIDDVRATAAYRGQVVSVIADRALARAAALA